MQSSSLQSFCALINWKVINKIIIKYNLFITCDILLFVIYYLLIANLLF